MLRTYLLKAPANTRKLGQVRDVAVAYRHAAGLLSRAQWRLLFECGALDKNTKVSIATPLSARYQQTCQYQVVAMLSSYLAQRQEAFASAVMRSSLSDKLGRTIRHQLLALNKAQAWYRPNFSLKGVPLDAETLRLARNILRGVLARARRPGYKRINMALDAKVATVEAAEGSRDFELWLKLATLERGAPIYLPLQSSPFYDQAPGQRKNFVQVNYTETGELRIGLVKESAPTPYAVRLPLLGLDVGLRTLVATSEGDLCGRDLMRRLSAFDQAISTLAANRQKQGLKVRCRRYDKRVRRLRAFLKYETHRVLKHLVLRHRPAEVAVERLDFRAPELSRRMNWLVQNFGRRTFKDALAGYAEQFGFTVVEVNPASTSQECHRSGFVAKTNRRGEGFTCGYCKKHVHADVDGAKVIRGRRSVPLFVSAYVKHSAILGELNLRFAKRCKTRRHRPPRVPDGWVTPARRGAQKFHVFP